ncbi:MAG: hypothetical protein HOO00_02415 [Rhodospirillaceae bacterium]|jgi:hypothetical protein|nr:hypothetical protein [Rhodospirillaceae bacterium]MBT5375042.1 hypothetical protein [Rhodospirillaceae bacterium]MBT5658804.1 hypothetical protein [Rhodospirillaceae bacterium]
MSETVQNTEELRDRLEGSNINPNTFLATDYLNHFNELVMFLEMIPDMPDMLEEAKAWQPKTYSEHFRDSCFSEKDLAIEAYEAAPQQYKVPFDYTVKLIDKHVAKTIEDLEEPAAANDTERLRVLVSAAAISIGELVDTASAIIHGHKDTSDQDWIDSLMDKTSEDS